MIVVKYGRIGAGAFNVFPGHPEEIKRTVDLVLGTIFGIPLVPATRDLLERPTLTDKACVRSCGYGSMEPIIECPYCHGEMEVK